MGVSLRLIKKNHRLTEIKQELEHPDIWKQQEKAQALGKERAQLEDVVHMMEDLQKHLRDTEELYELASSENDTETLEVITKDAEKLTKKIEELEFRRMFSGEMDANACLHGYPIRFWRY